MTADWLENRRCLFVFPHPDDEVHACTALWRRLRTAGIPVTLDALWVTTGCPSPDLYTRAEPFEEYRRQRLKGTRRAQCQLAPMLDSIVNLDLTSRSTVARADKVRDALEATIRAGRHDTVFVCPLEGAHPDHDLLAATVHRLLRSLPSPPASFEYTSYHLSPAGPVTGRFATQAGPEREICLEPPDAELKRRLIGCYATEGLLARFPLLSERFRATPRHLSLAAYKTGRLFYRTWDARVDWRAVHGTLSRLTDKLS